MSIGSYFSNFKSFCVKNCPDFIMHELIRSRVNIDYNLSQDFHFRIADNYNDLHKSLGMLYRSYLNAGKIKPNLMEIHTVPRHLLNKTEMIICKYKGDVIATVSLVKKDNNNLPCEKIYDISDIYAKGRNVYELSCLAVDERWRNKTKDIIFPLFKYAYNYMIRKNDHNAIWVIIANPKFIPLYRGIFGFDFLQNGHEIRSCASSNGAPVNGLYLDLNNAREFMNKFYSNKEAKKNLNYYYTEFNMPNFFFPKDCRVMENNNDLIAKSFLEYGLISINEKIDIINKSHHILH